MDIIFLYLLVVGRFIYLFTTVPLILRLLPSLLAKLPSVGAEPARGALKMPGRATFRH